MGVKVIASNHVVIEVRGKFHRVLRSILQRTLLTMTNCHGVYSTKTDMVLFRYKVPVIEPVYLEGMDSLLHDVELVASNQGVIEVKGHFLLL